MHPKTVARRAALKALVVVERTDTMLSAALGTQEIPAATRSFAHEIATNTLRHRAHLDYTLAPLLKKPLNKLDAPVRAALRLALYERAFLATPAPVVGDEYAGLMRGEKLSSAVAFVSAVARHLPPQLREAPDLRQDPVAHLSIQYSHPAWLVERWLKRFGFDECAALCAANNQIAPLSLRVNTLRASREAILAGLVERGLQARASSLAPTAILAEQAGSPTDWPEWKSGMILAQDEAAQLVAPLAAPQPGQIVIDAAAAPGGKTTHLAQIMQDKGRIIACDVAPGRLKLIEANAQRLGLSCLELQAGDFRSLVASLPPADVVLLDAPCLGTGTLRRRPDAKWRKTLGQLKELVALQRELLAAAVGVVRPGGTLVYATCSLEPEENAAQVDYFLHHHTDWQIERASDAALLPMTTAEGFLQTMPQRNGCDGMFTVKFRRGM
ncbi:MAG: 16S rRNA (cytosine(967)-C(5))-methyltransferase RsmB [Abitibacteriaceae bacterium]|nr:16S rRNA (cytosine(967)-C(5))-methyltransferase RsmB [Abditibacteriaceae bacterium]